MIFPKWSNRLVLGILAGAPILVVGAITAFALYISPYNQSVGFAPKQPIAYSHKLHAGDLGIDCRYCHVNVETAPVAMVPPAETCMNCHATILTESVEVKKIKQAYDSGEPIQWERIHRLPHYVYFDHAIHVNSSVGCETCHGRIDHMEVVHQAKTLSMGWCLDCHRNSEKYLRPGDEITNMAWEAEDQLALGRELKAAGELNPTTNCSGCHR